MAGIRFEGKIRGARVRGDTPALLLAIAVFLCHGLYGASHQVHAFGPEAAGQAAHGHHHATHGGADHGEGGRAGHPDGTAYAAAFSAALFAAVVAVALGGPRIGPRAALAAHAWRRYPDLVINPATHRRTWRGRK